MFGNGKNRKTAIQNGQKPKNRTRFWWENANRKLLLKPQNRIKNRQKPQNRTKKTTKTAKPHEKIDENRETANL